MQVPGNFDAPSHAAVRELASSPRWLDALRDIPFRVGKVVDSAAEYAGMLADAGLHGRHVGDHLRPRTDRRASGAGLDHRHRADPGEERARRGGVAAVPHAS